MRPAVIFGHPASLHTPQDVERLEEQTGRRAIFDGQIVKLQQVECESETYDCPIHGNLGEEDCPRC